MKDTHSITLQHRHDVYYYNNGYNIHKIHFWIIYFLLKFTKKVYKFIDKKEARVIQK